MPWRVFALLPAIKMFMIIIPLYCYRKIQILKFFLIILRVNIYIYPCLSATIAGL